MAVTHILTAFTLFVSVNVTSSRQFHRHHVSEEGGTVLALCAPHTSYITRKWFWFSTLLRPNEDIYTQYSFGSVTKGRGARPDIVLNHTDGSLTISSLQMKDTGWLRCSVAIEGDNLYSETRLIVYNRRVDVMLGRSVTLQCPVSAAVYSSRQWYIKPNSGQLLYNQTASGVTEGNYGLRDDISLNTKTFELTIGDVRQDDIIYTCRVTSGQGVNAAFTFLAIYNGVVETEEGTSVTLQCAEVWRLTNRAFQNINGAEWSRTWQRVTGNTLYLQYRYNGVFYERRPTTRPDITLDNSTFSLTIRRPQLSDNTAFVCTFFISGPDVFESVKLNVYVNPKITLSGLDDTPVSVGSTVTVTCTIDRVYPELGPGDFTMRWGKQTFMSTGSQNGDKSYRYTVWNVRTVTDNDHGTVVECLVNPTRGRSDYIMKTIILNTQPQTPFTPQPLPTGTSSTVTSTKEVMPTETTNVPPPVMVGPSLPVIGGAVAAAVVIVILIVIIIILCVRQKAQDNTVTAQTPFTPRPFPPGTSSTVTSTKEVMPPETTNVPPPVTGGPSLPVIGGAVAVQQLYLSY